ncbi:MAG: phenylalanine--tRNA ligase subunit beta [Thermoplasmata archaeon]
MVVVKFQKSELFELTDIKSIKDIEPVIEKIGIEIKREDEDSIDIELYPDRPDLIPIEGLARAINNILISDNLKEYKARSSKIDFFVDSDLIGIRPYIVSALIKNLKVNDQVIKDMMETQEKLHLTVGRKREKVAIGLHDFDKVKAPFYYFAADPIKTTFKPLGMEKVLNLKEILREHAKGKEYGDILKNFEKYPVIKDSNNNILSFPPIINGSLTEITSNTKNVLIDCTGTDLKTLIFTLNILATAFADRKAELYKVKIHYPFGDLILPDLKYQSYTIKKEHIKRLLGMDFSDEVLLSSLKKMGYEAHVYSNSLRVKSPPYRMDIMHENDIIEDIAKGFGFENFVLTLPEIYTVGFSSALEDLKNRYRSVMTGFQFIEVTTLTLIPSINEFSSTEDISLLNPVTEDQTLIRNMLIPSLFNILNKNRHNPLPQKIFEIGDVIYNQSQETHVAGLAVYSKAGFTDIKSYVESLFNQIGIEINIEPTTLPFFIDGRAASILHNNEKIGFFGEFHPHILEKFEIANPTIGFESKIV